MTTKTKAQEVNIRTCINRYNKFIERATEKYGDKFDYSHVLEDFVNSRTPVRIICPTHGQFQQLPNGHLNGTHGCFECGEDVKRDMGRVRRLTTEGFIEKSKAAFGELYDYSQTVYATGTSPVVIVCPEHGPFTIVRAEKHYMSAQGCPSCAKAGSMAEQIILDAIKAHNVVVHKEYAFSDCVSPTSGRKLRFDFYIPSYNIILEYHGEQHFRKSPMMHKGDRFERMQEHDRIKKAYALDNGYTFIELTTKDLSQLQDIVTRLFQ